MKRIMLIVATLAIVAAPGLAQNSVAVQSYAALNGTNYGLEVSLDGSTNAVYVRDDSPQDETTYRASFWLDTNSVNDTSANGYGRIASVLLGRGGSTVGTPDPPTTARFVIQVWRLGNTGNYRIKMVCADNTNLTRRQVYLDGIAPGQQGIIVPDGAYLITAETIFRSSADGGLWCHLYANGQEAWSPGVVQSSFGDIESVFFGAPRDLSTFASGSLYLDEFSSFRTLAP